MRALTSFFLVVFSTSFTWAYQAAPAPTPGRTPDPYEARRRIQENEVESQRFETLRGAGNAVSKERARSITRNEAARLYRDATRKELKELSPNASDLRAYREFLSMPKTGLIRLTNDPGCDGGTNVVVATDECLRYSMPGGGSSYSFRTDGYRIRRLADLTFSAGLLEGRGVLSHSIMVALGNVDLEKVTLKTPGMGYLVTFAPEVEFEKARQIDLDLMSGVSFDGFVYRRSVPAIEGVTYALRSIAYKGKYYRAVEGFAYNELDFDKRRDITVAFRIVRRDDDGSVTILWKRLDSRDAPTVQQAKKDSEQINRQNKFTVAGY